jgi:hypothetical protein
MNLNKVLKHAKSIKRKAKKATPGPWEVMSECNNIDCIELHIVEETPRHEFKYNIITDSIKPQIVGCLVGGTESGIYPNYSFIASAREDVPYLADQLIKLIKKYKRMQKKEKK